MYVIDVIAHKTVGDIPISCLRGAAAAAAAATAAAATTATTTTTPV